MESKYLAFLLAPIIISAFTGCALVPSSIEMSAPREAQQATPNMRFGIMMERGSPDAEPDVATMVDYQQQRIKQREAEAGTSLAAPAWQALGPSNGLGRVVDIAFHPQNNNIIYLASPGGGAYKTSDAGGTWTRLSGLPYQVINSIAIDPLNPNVIYFATGHYAGSGQDLLSMGVYKTVDGGTTFSRLQPTVPTISSQDWLYITRVMTHPTTANLVLAATAKSFFVSNDGGATWRNFFTTNISVYDIAINPNDSARVLLGTYQGATIQVNLVSGAVSLVQIVPAKAFTHTRIKYAKSTPNVVYASVNQNEGELHKSVDGGLTWSKISTPMHNGTEGFHTNQLWVSPVDANHIIVGGVDLYRSLDGGLTFIKISNWRTNSSQTGAGMTPATPHGDHNAVVSPPNYSATNPQLFVGTDGGLFATADARTATETTGWNRFGGGTTGLFISQLGGAAGRRLNGVDTIVGGLQDNGSVRWLGNVDWKRLIGGDGDAMAIDQLEDIAYGQIQKGVLHRSKDSALSKTICAGITESDPASCGSSNTQAVNFFGPLEIEPRNSLRLYFGANSLWMSANPQADPPTWSVVKSPSPGTTPSFSCVDATKLCNYISAISIYEEDPNIVLVGHNDGQVFRTTNISAATPAWTLLGGGLPTGRMVGALLVDPRDSNRLYVGFTGYFADNLWRSDNGGTTWQSISAGLPPGSIYTITRHPLAKEKLYVGTIWGSYGSDNGGVSWPTVNDGPYGTQIRKLFWLGSDVLAAASYGSGLATAPIKVNATRSAANYSDLWWVGSAENGWGMTINHHSSDTQLNVLFVYDASGNPVWYVLPGGGVWNSDFTTYTGSLYQPRSAPLNAYNKAQFVVGAPVGTISINFTGKSTAVVSYTINGVSGQKSMRRQAFGRGNAPMTVGDMWWGGSTQDGWGISITQQAGILFGAWYTYGIDGKATWYVMTDGTWNGLTYTGSFVSLTSSAWLGTTYDPNRVRVVPAGTLSLTFSDANNALMTYAFTSGPFAGTTQTKAIVRQPY